MRLKNSSIKSTFLFWLVALSCSSSVSQKRILPGALLQDQYISLLIEKKVGVVAHKASLITENNSSQHLVDFLLENKIDIHSIFAPEHGFRGTADAGENVKDQVDPKTGIQIISLYGINKKPKVEQVKGIEIMIFDLQDVGVRFFTYLSTLHYVMEACAENDIPMIILDRPNPNLHYVDGPVMEEAYTSFLGMHPVPIVYGMTIGEYAQMINGEGWLKEGIHCKLSVIPVKNYNRKSTYELSVRPSPNLPNPQAISLYPSLCLLEPTVVSVGRGTDLQFQIYGHPMLPKSNFTFTPLPNFGAKNPKLKNHLCYGKNLTKVLRPNQLELKWLIDVYKNFPKSNTFFLKGFNRIAGNSSLKEQLISGVSEIEIRKSWKTRLELFKRIREKYLIYN
tara:strand:- start:780 stop:1958 length:1179 start_codon:yes stop_codon:yes gene_type:complete